MKRMLAGRLRQGLMALPCCLFFTGCITVFPALQLVRENAGEFWFTPWQMLPGMAAIWGLVVLALLLVMLLLPEKAARKAVAALLALGLMALLQGNGLNADYGELNGKAVDWGRYTLYGVLNTVEWAAAVFALCILSETKWGGRLLVLVPCALTLGLGALSASWLAESPRENTTGETVLTTEGIDTLGAERNLVLLIPDSVDAAMLAEAIESDDSVRTLLDGFTFYENAMGLSDPTKFGVPAILTGCVYDTATDYAGFIRSAYGRSALFSGLLEGWDARVYTDKRYVALDETALQNAQVQTLTVGDGAAMAGELWRLCAFRVAPHFLKPQFWAYTGFDQFAATAGAPVYTENDEAYYASLTSGGLSTVPGKAFRVIHLTGMHPPYTMNAACEYVGAGVTAQEQMTGCLTLLGEYLAQLEALGLRDVTDVVILADHGTSEVHRPMLLLRRAGETGPLKSSEAPVSYADLQATYRALLTGEDAADALWNIGSEPRTRLYYHESSTNDDFNYYQYATDAINPAWEDLAATGTVYHGDAEAAATPYALGTTLYFDLRATARRYLVSGFSSADFLSTWTSGDTAEIALPLAALPAQDHMTAALSFLSVMQGSQRLKIESAGETLFEGTVTDLSVSFSVPARCVEAGVLRLRFTFPDAISHKDAGKSDDTRKVAFAVTELTVRDGD